jgi:hypothetical protein
MVMGVRPCSLVVCAAGATSMMMRYREASSRVRPAVIGYGAYLLHEALSHMSGLEADVHGVMKHSTGYMSIMGTCITIYKMTGTPHAFPEVLMLAIALDQVLTHVTQGDGIYCTVSLLVAMKIAIMGYMDAMPDAVGLDMVGLGPDLVRLATAMVVESLFCKSILSMVPWLPLGAIVNILEVRLIDRMVDVLMEWDEQFDDEDKKQ